MKRAVNAYSRHPHEVPPAEHKGKLISQPRRDSEFLQQVLQASPRATAIRPQEFTSVPQSHRYGNMAQARDADARPPRALHEKHAAKLGKLHFACPAPAPCIAARRQLQGGHDVEPSPVATERRTGELDDDLCILARRERLPERFVQAFRARHHHAAARKEVSQKVARARARQPAQRVDGERPVLGESCPVLRGELVEQPARFCQVARRARYG